MDTEVLLKIVEGSSAITLLTIGIFYLISQRRRRHTGNGYVTQLEFENTVVESRRLNDQKHKEILDTVTAYSTQANLDRQNLYDHASDHTIHGSS